MKSNESQTTLIASLLACGTVLTASAATSIGINFVNGGDHINNAAADSMLSAETAGAPGYVQGNWNNLGRWGQNVAVVNDSGINTTVGVSWDSIGTWTSGASVDTGDGKMMSGYLDASWGTGANTPIADGTGVFGVGNNNKPLVYVDGVSSWLALQGASTYSVVVYFDTDSFDAGRVAEFWIQSVTGNSGSMTVGADLTPHIFGLDDSTFSGTYTQATSTALAGATAGNYAVFSGLSADQFLLRGEENGWASDAITGFQIVATVPEPSVAALLIGAAGLTMRRRRFIA